MPTTAPPPAIDFVEIFRQLAEYRAIKVLLDSLAELGVTPRGYDLASPYDRF